MARRGRGIRGTLDKQRVQESSQPTSALAAEASVCTGGILATWLFASILCRHLISGKAWHRVSRSWCSVFLS